MSENQDNELTRISARGKAVVDVNQLPPLCDDPGSTYFWMGRPLESLSKDELIEVVKQLGSQVQAFYTPSAIRARSLGKVEMLRRGER